MTIDVKTIIIRLAAAALMIQTGVAADPAPSPAPAAPGRTSYDSFSLVHTRNVFDPDRRPVRPVRETPTVSAPTARADFVALTGTMIDADKTLAFFSGSKSEFNRVLSVKGKIADATITQITANNIEVEREGKRTLVSVGQTVPLDSKSVPGAAPAPDSADTAPAAVTSASSATAAPPAAGNNASANAYNNAGTNRGGGRRNNNTAAAAATPAKAPPANIEEIKRRMMEKRQQENK